MQAEADGAAKVQTFLCNVSLIQFMLEGDSCVEPRRRIASDPRQVDHAKRNTLKNHLEIRKSLHVADNDVRLLRSIWSALAMVELG